MSDYEEIRKALTHLDANDRDFWVRMGAAVKDELGEDGFELWDEWSRQSDTYKPNDAKAVWKSLKQGHIHIGTLFYHARENGYRPDKPYTPPSAEELAKRAQAAQEKQRAEAERIAKDHAKAAKTAYGIWKNASPADPNHAYAKNKGLGLSEAAMNAIRQNEYNGKKQLIIPLYSDKKLVNVQTIDEDGNKSFLSGGQKQGAYTVIGDFRQHQNGVILAEGFATAASVHQATGKPVIVAFDAGNLKAVSEKLVNVLPENVPVYFAADNDPKETGLVKAQAAAQIWGERAQIAMPTFSAKQIDEYQAEHGKFDSHGNENVPTDFNDLHKLAGIEAVREQLNTMITPEIRQPENPTLEKETMMENPNIEPSESSLKDYVKPELSREELLQNNYWRVQNSYDPLPENDMELPENPPIEPEPMPDYQPDYQPDEMSEPMDYYNYNFEDLPTAPPQPQQPEPTHEPTAASEHDAAVSVPAQEKQPEIINGIEYGSLQHEQEQPEKTEEPQPEPFTEPAAPKKPTVEQSAPTQQPETDEPELPRPEALERQPILDLAYERPPKHLQSRYVVADNGQYLSADNHTTVLFEDKGNALKTAKSDQQTIQDMLEVAKAKGWDSIKISGSPEFKSQMYVAAESQGIKTSGYKPTPADLAMVAKLREDRSLNGIQSTHKPELDPKQPENAPTHQPDAATLSAADKLKTQSAMPNERQINSSPIADTEEAPKISSLGSKTIPSEVLRSTHEMTAAALSPEVETAKSAYDQKAKQLSEPNQARLKAYERNTMDALRDVQGDARNHALRNFYEHTTKVMNGTELNLPQPLQHQAPAQQQTHEPKPSNSQEFEMER